MNEYENNTKEHKVTIVIGMVLVALLAIFVAKKRSRLNPEPYGVHHVSEDKSDYSIADILPDASSAEERHVAGAGEDEISVSIGIGGDEDVVEPVEVSVALVEEEEVVEPVSREQESVRYTTYVVRKGDTLSAIAQRFYGDASRWRLIAKANDLVDPRMVCVGMELIIPEEKTEPSRPTRPAVAPRIDVAAGSEDDTKEVKDYTVKKNDSLWKIAAAEYGDGNKWTTVFEANRDSIRDKNSLRPGQVIKLP